MLAVFLGFIGTLVWSPLKGALQAGAHARACVDLAAGTGVALSLLFSAAVAGGYSDILYAAWNDTPVLANVPLPILQFDWLLPDAAEDILSRVFNGQPPIVDVLLLIATTLVGVLGMAGSMFRPSRWAPESGSTVFLLILLRTGMAMLLAIPMLVLSWMANAGA